MTEKRRDFSTLLRTQPPASAPASADALREGTWRRIFAERGLVWARHALIAPAVAACVAAEMQRVQESGGAREVFTSNGAVLRGAEGDALIAGAESFVARGSIPALEVQTSSLKGVGLGLFASEALPAGELIGEYTGLVCLIDDVEEGGAYAYEAWPRSPLAIDACTAGNHTRFVNHSREPNLDVLQCVVASSWRVLLATRRPIAVGEELYFDYGQAYWRRRRMIE